MRDAVTRIESLSRRHVWPSTRVSMSDWLRGIARLGREVRVRLTLAFERERGAGSTKSALRTQRSGGLRAGKIPRFELSLCRRLSLKSRSLGSQHDIRSQVSVGRKRPPSRLSQVARGKFIAVGSRGGEGDGLTCGTSSRTAVEPGTSSAGRTRRLLAAIRRLEDIEGGRERVRD